MTAVDVKLESELYFSGSDEPLGFSREEPRSGLNKGRKIGEDHNDGAAGRAGPGEQRALGRGGMGAGLVPGL